MVISRRALTRLHTPRIKRPVDYPGAVLMTIALAPLLIGITRVGQGAPWLDELNMELLGASIAAMALFLWQEKRAVEPIVPLSRSEEHTSELQSLMRISYAVFCLKKKRHKR